ncbi:MAG: SoxXA-binding protein [Gammaproteobacteria bacterium]|jgi:type II secretory pathway pseudopilin PulG
MRLKTLLTAAGLALLLSGTATAADKAAAEQAIAEAKSALETASAADGAWRDTGKMIKAAEEAVAAGDFDKALKTAEQAKFQGIMGTQQANEQANVGNPDYLY